MRTNRPSAASKSSLARLRTIARPGQRWFPLVLFAATLAMGLLIGLLWVAKHAPQTATPTTVAASSTVAPEAQHSTLPAPMAGDLSALHTPTSGTAGIAHVVPTPTAMQPAANASSAAPAAISSVAVAAQPAETPPQLLERNAPAYPPEALRNQEEGTVHLRVSIDAQGSVQDVQVQQSSHSRLLDTAAMDAVRGWKFHPATQNGQPVPSTIEVPIDFHLDQH